MPTARTGEESMELDSISSNPFSKCVWNSTVTVCEAFAAAEIPERRVPTY